MTSATYPNFYESIAEAHIRLLRTVVVYEGEPYKVLAVTDHKKDGIFRIYLWPTGITGARNYDDYPQVDDSNPTNTQLGEYLDKFIESKKDCKLIRKYMSAAGFNKFRPFPLGMVNYGDYAFYVERKPVRRTEQGLSQAMLKETKLQPVIQLDMRNEIGSESAAMRDCILGKYPSPQEVVANLNNPACRNISVAFNRQCAIVRGPLETLYLAYKSEVVGLLPYNTLEQVVLGKNHRHLKEVISELGLFASVTQK